MGRFFLVLLLSLSLFPSHGFASTPTPESLIEKGIVAFKAGNIDEMARLMLEENDKQKRINVIILETLVMNRRLSKFFEDGSAKYGKAEFMTSIPSMGFGFGSMMFGVFWGIFDDPDKIDYSIQEDMCLAKYEKSEGGGKEQGSLPMKKSGGSWYIAYSEIAKENELDNMVQMISAFEDFMEAAEEQLGDSEKIEDFSAAIKLKAEELDLVVMPLMMGGKK